MRFMLLCLLLAVVTISHSQTDPVLDAYLIAHRYKITRTPDGDMPHSGNELSNLILEKMKGKNLLIYGEGFSHYLKLNTDLRRVFMQQLITKGLKYYFEEAPRSWVTYDNLRIANLVDSSFIRYSSRSPAYYHVESELYKSGNYQYAAIDFERQEAFHRTLEILLRNVDKNNLPALYKLAPYLQDSSYLELSKNKFVAFYNEQQERFYADSNSYKPLLGLAYPYFRYLFSDPNPSSFNDNRNENMAIHLLAQIGDPKPDDVFLLSIGIGHIQKKDGVRKTTTTILEESEQLKGKILIATLYCDECKVPQEDGSNSWFKSMNGNVLRSFQNAANSDIVLFDFTELPEQYKDICNNTDLLIFARKQN